MDDQYPEEEDDGEKNKRAAVAATDLGGGLGRFYGWPSSRIVRVSRASGEKDRHSKVLTSKGLRDRPVRLSVNTAIQFYDLQDRLGYGQPQRRFPFPVAGASPSPSPERPIPRRRSIQFYNLDAAVKSAGGVAIVIVIDEGLHGKNIQAYVHSIPGLTVTIHTLQTIRNYIDHLGSKARATIVFHGTELGIKPAPIVAAFSSRGPTFVSPFVMKPGLI